MEIDEQTEKPSHKKDDCPSNNYINHPKVSKCPVNTAANLQDAAKPNEQITLVIGDSMVKNIDSKKIQQAGGHKLVCHSYSGARVKQIEKKLRNDGDGQHENVILHVGTNDLVHADPNKVARENR